MTLPKPEAAIVIRPAGAGTSAWRAYSMVGALIVLWIFFNTITDGTYLGARNFSNLLRQTAITGILASGMLMVIVTGHIDLSVGSLVGLTGGVAAIAETWWHWDPSLALGAGLAAGLAVGALHGALVAYAQVPAFIATLGGLLAWRGALKAISGGNTIPIQSRPFRAIGQEYLPEAAGIALAAAVVLITVWVAHKTGSTPLFSARARKRGLTLLLPALLGAGVILRLNTYLGVPVPVLLLLLVAAGATFLMQQTTFGRYLYAIGGNAEAARLSGINLKRHALAVFCVMGGLSGVAGMVYTARVGSAAPDAGTLLELDAIAACVIGGASLVGGRGSVLGAGLGALFMASLDNGMSLNNVPDFAQDIVKGVILVAAVGIDMWNRKSAG